MKQDQVQQSPRQPKDKTKPFRGNGFALDQLEDWQDKTIYTLTGPVEDAIQHNVVITLEQDSDFETVREYAEWQIGALEQELKACRLLKKGSITLANGVPAYKAIFSWQPTDAVKVYQEQIFVLVERTAYKLTATFNRKTRKTLGPQIERMMLSFTPGRPK